MTRYLIASSFVPGVRGGADKIAADLAAAMRHRGLDVDTLMLPVWDAWEELPQQLLGMRLWHLEGAADRLIALRTPAHLLRHPDKVVWFLHHHRGAYDLWGTEHGTIPDTDEGRQVRDVIATSDHRALAEASRVYAISRVTAGRLQAFGGVDAAVMYPPLLDPEGYRCDEAEDFVFLPGRITPAKRQLLAVEAMAHVPSPTRLVIAGAPDQPEHLVPVRRAIAHLGLDDRVDVLEGWLPEDDKRDLMARCLACVFPPFDEDYGYVSLEAAHSSKPVITCTDSGGTLEFVEDGVTGLVAAPTPEALGAAIARLAGDRRAAREMGVTAHTRAGAMGPSWDRVVDELTRA